MSKPLFSKGSSTVKFKIKSIKYCDLDEDTAMNKEIATDPKISLLLSSAFIKIRQNTSSNQGLQLLETNDTELVYIFKSNLGLVGEADTSNPADLSTASRYPLGEARLLNRVVEIILVPNPKIWEKQAELICKALRGDQLILSKGEKEYIALNRNAINTEAAEEQKCLSVRGCLVQSVAVGE